MPFEPVEIKCGMLDTNSAPEDVGLKNYTVKRDFRRIAPDRDARREGYLPFQPNGAHATVPANLPSATNQPTIIKITQIKAGNGKTLVICANADTLFSYYSLEVGDYFVGDQTANAYFDDLVEAPYFQEQFNDWTVIGSGFSGFSTYWEAVQVNNILVLNNGIDLPVWFNAQNQTVTPMYELRDQGIASVGTIWEYNGILMLGNVVEIDDTIAAGQNVSTFQQLMNTQYAYARFNATDPSNLPFTFPLGGPYPVVGNAGPALSAFINSVTSNFQYRVIWSMPGLPNRFAVAVPCATNFGSNHIVLLWPSKSFTVGQQILVLGAGVNGGNIIATILWINPGGTDFYLDMTMLATISPTLMQALDSVGSNVGFQDLDDDGSAIIRGEKIRTSCAIYKDTSIFICNYTGATGAPFVFQRVYAGENSIYYRNTLVSVQHDWQSWHFFAGRNSFYRFDLINLTPTPIFKEIDNLFFSNAANLATLAAQLFASDNSITNEIYLSNPGSADRLLCFDYKYNTASTSSMAATCGAAVQFPTAQIVTKGTYVFLMGDAGNLGAIIQYGLKNDGSPPVFNRCIGVTPGAGYTSTLASGISAVGARLNDTQVNGYELRSKNLNGRVTLSLLAGTNPDQVRTLFSLDRTGATGPASSLFIPCGFIGQVFGDSIVVTDANVTCEVVARILLAEEIPTLGTGRQ